MNIDVINKFNNAYFLLYDFYQSIETTKTEEELSQSIKKFLLYGDVISVIENNQIAAMLNLYCNNTQTYEAYICDVYVREEYRRQGLARKMLYEALVICRERKFKAIRLHVNYDNVPAIKLYKNLGFIITENTDEKYKHLQEMILTL